MTKYAFLIGINNYSSDPDSGNPGLPPLKCAVNDVVAITGALKNIYGFRDEEITLMTCSPGARDPRFPSRKNILKQLEKIPRQKLDSLLIIFCGHGFGGVNSSGMYDLYLCPVNAEQSTLETSAISLRLLTETVKAIGAMNTCVILDCCQNLPGARNVVVRSQQDEDLMAACTRDIQAVARPQRARRRKPTTIFMNSCSVNQCAYEWTTQGHGIFTAYLLKAMKRSGRVTDWIDLIGEVVYDKAQELYGREQHPYLRVEGGRNIYFPMVKTVGDATAKTNNGAQADKPVPPPPLEKQAGDRVVLAIKEIEYPFRWCPPGTFMMGSPVSEKNRRNNETQHQVTLTKGFWLLETPVTQAMWEGVMGNNPSHFKNAKWPVIRVSWDGCQDYIQKLNNLSVAPKDYRFSLPTEAQWEYACRAGTTTPFHFGCVQQGDMANCGGGPPYDTIKQRGNYPSEVGSYPANAWGLYDMHGNVGEWCSNCYDDYPDGNTTDPTGPFSGENRAFRGGSFGFFTYDCRSAARYSLVPTDWRDDVGLRLALIREG